VISENLQGILPEEQIENAKRSRDPLKALAGYIPDSISATSGLKLRAELCSKQAKGLVERTISTIQQWRKLTKLCSFSAINDSLLMWGHYADNHRGFCLEYDLEGLDADHSLREKLYPVIYTNEIYDLTPWAQTLANQDRGGFNVELPILCVIYKCDEWKYEEEWRKVSVTPTVQPDHNVLVPIPARVFLGSKMEAANVEQLRTICSYKGIEVWQMRLAEDKFKLVPDRLS